MLTKEEIALAAGGIEALVAHIRKQDAALAAARGRIREIEDALEQINLIQAKAIDGTDAFRRALDDIEKIARETLDAHRSPTKQK